MCKKKGLQKRVAAWHFDSLALNALRSGRCQLSRCGAVPGVDMALPQLISSKDVVLELERRVLQFRSQMSHQQASFTGGCSGLLKRSGRLVWVACKS